MTRMTTASTHRAAWRLNARGNMKIKQQSRRQAAKHHNGAASRYRRAMRALS